MTDTTTLLPCPSCEAINRVQVARLADNPICSRCQTRLTYPDSPVTVTTQSFEKEVLSWPGIVVVDFWAEWCGPCKAIAPILVELAKERAGQLKIAKVDVDANQPLSQQFDIRSIPTLMLFKKGRKEAQQAGIMTKSMLMSWIDSAQ